MSYFYSSWLLESSHWGHHIVSQICLLHSCLGAFESSLPSVFNFLSPNNPMTHLPFSFRSLCFNGPYSVRSCLTASIKTATPSPSLTLPITLPFYIFFVALIKLSCAYLLSPSLHLQLKEKICAEGRDCLEGTLLCPSTGCSAGT